MATKTEALRPEGQEKQLIDMSWDPITRIVGSLGIYTKIDWANKVV
ncbi:MAG: hydrogenase large subunit, partial [Ilumatobacteraceae bacterium]